MENTNKAKKERSKVKVHKGNVYYRFNEKVNTLVGSRGRLDLFGSSLLINLSQVISLWMLAKFGPNHVKSSCLLILFCLGIDNLFYNSFPFVSIFILPNSANVDPESNNWYHSMPTLSRNNTNNPESELPFENP